MSDHVSGLPDEEIEAINHDAINHGIGPVITTVHGPAGVRRVVDQQRMARLARALGGGR